MELRSALHIQPRVTGWERQSLLGRGGRCKSSQNSGVVKIGLTPTPNPGTLVDLTTKGRKCDSRKSTCFGVNLIFWGEMLTD